MRWRPWPPLISRKYEVKLVVKRLEGGGWVHEGAEKDNGGLAVEIRWKGPKISLGSFRRTVKRNCTREETLKRVDGPNGGVLVEWDEEFQSVCSLSGHKENVFHPWEINFNVLHVSQFLPLFLSICSDYFVFVKFYILLRFSFGFDLKNW